MTQARAASFVLGLCGAAISRDLEGEDPAKFAHALAYIRKAPREVETPVRDEDAKRWRG